MNFKIKNIKELLFGISILLPLFLTIILLSFGYIESEFIVEYSDSKNYLTGFLVGMFLFYIFYLINKNIKEEDTLNNKLESKEKELKELKEINEIINESLISVTTDIDGIITSVTNSFIKTYGYSLDEIIGNTHSIIKSDSTPNDFHRTIWLSISNGDIWSGEILNKSKDGKDVWALTTIIPEMEKEKIVRYKSISHNITHEKKQDFLHEFDNFTGLPNKYSFESILNRSIKLEKEKEISIFFINIDNFKDINEIHGYKGGDEIIKIISSRLVRFVGKDNIVSRYSGDEFALIIFDKDEKESIIFAEEIVNKIKEEIIISKNHLFLNSCLGISLFPKDGTTTSSLIKNANSAMQFIKKNDEKNVMIYTDNILKEHLRKLDVVATNTNCLEEEGFKLVYQAKYDIANKVAVGGEALIRMKNNKYFPDEFIKSAEESGIVGRISEWVINQVLSDIYSIKDKINENFSISINLSSQDIKNENFLNLILKKCKDYKLNPRVVSIEITEYTLMDNINIAIGILQKFRDNGIKVYIDDFGTGYSSMNYLKILPIDVIKIDKSFIDNIEINKKDEHITSAIVNLATLLNCETVVEGIEEGSQEKILLSLGCVYGQGYNFSKPIDFNDFTKLFNLN